jgi:hypothetical protein
LVSSTPIIGRTRPLSVINAHEEMGNDDVLNISSVELGEKLFAKLLYRGFYVSGGEWSLWRGLEPRVIKVLGICGLRR